MRVYLDSVGKILGFYPEEIDYAILPESLVEITNEQYQDVIKNGYTHIDSKGNGYTPPVPEPYPTTLLRLTLREKLQNLGLSDTDIEALLGRTV